MTMALVYRDHEHEDRQLYKVVSYDYGPGVQRP